MPKSAILASFYHSLPWQPDNASIAWDYVEA
jgi:hypothetical protein